MKSSADKAAAGAKGGRSWSLTNPEKARKRLVRLLNEFHRGDIESTERFRATVYGFSVLLQFFRMEADKDLEERISALEEREGLR